MSKIVEKGFDEYFQRLTALTEVSKHELTVVNAMQYAIYLQDRFGYYVFNNAKMLEFAKKHFVALVKSGVDPTDKVIRRTLEAAAHDYLNFLRSSTTELRPPVKAGEGLRQAHPGGWADITGNLNRAYWFMVDGRRFVQ